MIGIVIAVLLAIVVYVVLAAFTSPIVGIVGAILVLLAGIPTGGYGLGSRFGSRA